jgi:hypothetical protein
LTPAAVARADRFAEVPAFAEVPEQEVDGDLIRLGTTCERERVCEPFRLWPE